MIIGGMYKMKIISSKIMKEIKKMYQRWKTDKIIIDAGKNDNKKTMGVLVQDIDWLFKKLGFKE